MNVLVLGADGQVGHELCGALGCFATVVPATESDFDMAEHGSVVRLIDRARPSVIVNAAAYTDVDGAERDVARAEAVNADAVGALGGLAASRNIGLVHYSTDFVFDGLKPTPYVETDAPNPLNVYGRTKLAGERALLASGASAIVLRTAWVYSRHRKSFVSAILRLAREREALRIVQDQTGNPTFSRELAEATAMLLYGIRHDAVAALGASRGVYHLAGSGCCSRYELARAVLRLDPNRSEHKVKTVDPVSSDQYPLPARRPTAAVLDCSLARERFGLQLPAWEASLSRALES